MAWVNDARQPLVEANAVGEVGHARVAVGEGQTWHMQSNGGMDLDVDAQHVYRGWRRLLQLSIARM